MGVVTCLCLLWLGSQSYTRKVVVNGWLEPSEGVVHIHPHRGGRVQIINVKNGDEVSQGGVLITLSTADHSQAGSPWRDNLLRELKTQSHLIRSQMQAAEKMLQQRRQKITEDVRSAEFKLSLSNQQVATAAARLEVSQHGFSRTQSLVRNKQLPRVSLEQSRLAHLSNLSAWNQARHAHLLQQESISAMQHELNMLPLRQQQSQTELGRQLSELNIRMTQLAQQNSLTLTAPRDGMITNLQAKEGQLAAAGHTLLSLQPKNLKLQARLLIPVQAAGFVEPGQTLNIRYSAFAYQKFGVFKAQITTVSDTPLVLDKQSVDAQMSSQKVYQATAELTQQYITAYGRRQVLKSGMTFSADIHQSQRTLFEWLLEPLFAIRGHL